MKAAIYILAFLLIGPLYGQKKTIVTVQAPKVADDPRPKYFKLLLELALEKTVPEYGPFEIQVSKTMSSQGRDIKLLQSKVLDVTWTMSSIEREKVVEPVRFPLLMGLFGYRVCLVHKDNRDLFAKIKVYKIGRQASLQSVRGMIGPIPISCGLTVFLSKLLLNTGPYLICCV